MAYLRDVEGREVQELVHLGFSLVDLMRAGVNESQLIGQAGCPDSEVLLARETVTREAADKATGKNSPAGGSFKRALSRLASSSDSKVTTGDSAWRVYFSKKGSRRKLGGSGRRRQEEGGRGRIKWSRAGEA